MSEASPVRLLEGARAKLGQETPSMDDKSAVSPPILTTEEYEFLKAHGYNRISAPGALQDGRETPGA